MSEVKKRLLQILDTMPEYTDPEKLLFDLYKRYIELYGDDNEFKQVIIN